ncbi:MAG: GGDEF domain-containing protein [Treponema sp.]|nr:GGDEF domain-containing protein [Treponema sp.]
MSEKEQNDGEKKVTLSEAALWFRIEDLKNESRELNRAIADISQLVSYTQVDSMVDFLISKLNDYFIPETLVFMVKPPRKNGLRQFYYSNLQKVNKTLDPKYFYVLEEYFDNLANTTVNGYAVPFDNLVHALPENTFSDDFLKLKPKLVIPLLGIGGVYAIIYISEKNGGGSFSANEMFYIHRMFSVLAVTMQNGLHYEISITEPKTGLFTYDFFITRMEEAISNLRRYNRLSGMLIIDIDFFKHFNDTYGHLCGDKVLLVLADTLKNIVRENDCVARFGGEEFSILLTECDEDSLWTIAERIRLAVSEIVLYEKDQKLSITISVGGCLIHDIRGVTPSYIFKKADKALYYSKQHGRNRTTIYKLGFLDAMKISNGEDTSEE